MRPNSSVADRPAAVSRPGLDQAAESASSPVLHRLDGARAGFAGGICLLVLYSISTVLFVVRHAPDTGMLPFWGSFLPGFDGSSAGGIGLGFPLSFLYGAAGAWLFALIYNAAPARAGEDTEVT